MGVLVGFALLSSSSSSSITMQGSDPMWLSNPYPRVDLHAAGPQRRDLTARGRPKGVSPVVRVHIGSRPESEVGSHGSKQRSKADEALCASIIAKAARAEGAKGGRLCGSGSAGATVDISLLDRPAAREVAESWTSRGFDVAGQTFSASYDVGQQAAGTIKLVLKNMPAAWTFEGVTAILLECAGYDRGVSMVVEEFLGGWSQGGVLLDLPRLDTVVAYVVPPPEDEGLSRIPSEFPIGTNSVVQIIVQRRPNVLLGEASSSGEGVGVPLICSVWEQPVWGISW